MAKKIVCAVYDHAVQCFGQPFYVRARGEAVRSFTDEVNRAAQENNLYQHPEDFDLTQVAVFDDESGKFEEVQEVLIRGKDARRTE